MTIGESIKRARKAKGLTQKRLGELSGTSEGTVRQYEIGKRQPRLEQLQAIAAALGTNITELLVYVDPGIKSYWDPLTNEETALKTLLNSLGNDIIKARGTYFFAYESGDAVVSSEITKDDLNELLSCAQNGLKIAVKSLELKLLQSSFYLSYRNEEAPQPPPDPQEGTDTA